MIAQLHVELSQKTRYFIVHTCPPNSYQWMSPSLFAFLYIPTIWTVFCRQLAVRRYLTRGHSIGTSVITRVNTIAKAHLFVAVFSQLSILLIAYGGYSNYHGSCTLLLQINSFAPENSICVVPVTVHRLCQVQWLNVPRAKIPCGKHPNIWNLIIRFIVVTCLGE